MGCFDCDELQFHYSEGCDACIDSLYQLCSAELSCVLACKCGALIYG